MWYYHSLFQWSYYWYVIIWIVFFFFIVQRDCWTRLPVKGYFITVSIKDIFWISGYFWIWILNFRGSLWKFLTQIYSVSVIFIQRMLFIIERWSCITNRTRWYRSKMPKNIEIQEIRSLSSKKKFFFEIFLNDALFHLWIFYWRGFSN